MMPVGFAMGGGIFINNSLGEGKPRVALMYYNASMFFAMFVTCTQILALHLGMEIVIKAFTDQEAVTVLMRSAWFYLLAYTFFDTLQIMGSSVMRGALKMGWASIFNFVGYFIFGLPIAWYFGFKQDMSISGIWLGPTFACFFLTICYNIVIVSIDWKELIRTIEERTRLENEIREKLKAERLAEEADKSEHDWINDSNELKV